MIMITVIIIEISKYCPLHVTTIVHDYDYDYLWYDYDYILAIFYLPLKYLVGCFGLILQTWKGDIYFTEQAERVAYGNHDITTMIHDYGYDYLCYYYGYGYINANNHYNINISALLLLLS